MTQPVMYYLEERRDNDEIVRHFSLSCLEQRFVPVHQSGSSRPGVGKFLVIVDFLRARAPIEACGSDPGIFGWLLARVGDVAMLGSPSAQRSLVARRHRGGTGNAARFSYFLLLLHGFSCLLRCVNTVPIILDPGLGSFGRIMICDVSVARYCNWRPSA